MFFFLFYKDRGLAQWGNGGLSHKWSCGRFAISCVPNFLLNCLQMAYLKIPHATSELPCITQYPDNLVPLRIIFFLLCGTFCWFQVISVNSFSLAEELDGPLRLNFWRLQLRSVHSYQYIGSSNQWLLFKVCFCPFKIIKFSLNSWFW